MAVAEEHRVAGLLLQLRPQRRHLLRELMLLQRFLEHHLELLLLERLAEKVGGAEPHRLHDDARAALARDDDDRYVLVDLLERGERSQPVHAAGHDNVEQHGGGSLRVEASHGFVRVRHGQCVVVARAEKRAQEPAHREVIVNNQHL